MTKLEAEKLINEYLKPVYGFCLKHCKTPDDAADLAQDIMLKLYKALMSRDDICDVNSFVWRIAHNMLCNYYRTQGRYSVCVSVDELSETYVSSEPEPIKSIIDVETQEKLRQEIAYLSKMQRKIVVAYYYENLKLSDISKKLCVPLGTVKWHLFEAKKDLKRGMETMRNTSDLKFAPISFDLIGLSGYPGTMGDNSKLLRSSLAQNIVFCVYRSAKTVNQIADDLGVSPVYVESEAEFLHEYGFLACKNGRYIANMLIEEVDSELSLLHDKMYSKAAKLFANELYDKLISSDILSSENIWGGKITSDSRRDENFLLWALIPYIAAISGEDHRSNEISFEEAATIRPDGGQNVCTATIVSANSEMRELMKRWCGPCWNELNGYTLWQIDSPWSDRRVSDTYHSEAIRILTLLDHNYKGEPLSEDEYAFLSEKEIMSCFKDGDDLKTSYRCIWLEGKDITNKLLEIGAKIKDKYFDEFEKMKSEYSKEVLERTPEHLRKMRSYLLQYIFFSDGWFILYCIKELLDSGKLKLPTEEQKRSLTTLIVHPV